VLKLYVNAGVTLGIAPFNDAERALDSYQRGLKHAEQFLTQGEIAAGVREEVLRLYDGISTVFHNSGQKGLEIQHLPALCLWSWISLAKAEERAIKLRNWQAHLQTAPAYPDFTAAFQDLLHTVLLNWHSPQRPHRHFAFVSTETLLAISEGLYALEQAADNQKLHTVYHHYSRLAESSWVETALAQQNEQHSLQHRLDTLHAWWLYPLRWWLNYKLQDTQLLIQQQAELAQNADDWHRTIKQTEYALVTWLKDAILKQLAPANPKPLEDLPAIALGMLFASDTLQTGHSPHTLLQKWQAAPPWQKVATLRTAYAPNHWQPWATNPNKPVLSKWYWDLRNQSTETVRRLNIAWQQENKPQPELQTWLRELLTETSPTLAKHLQTVWETAQSTAPQIAQIFTRLDNPKFSGNLVSKCKDQDAPPYQYTHAAYQLALSAVILGDVETQLENAVSNWLKQQIPEKPNDIEILNIFNTLKHRFTRAVTLYRNPRHSELETAVHEWAKVLLQESLPQTDYAIIWKILERTRVGLNSLSLHLDENWLETLGKQLWQDLESSIRWLNEGYQPTEQDFWPPLVTWLKTLDKWLEKPPVVETCQAHLQPNEVLIQPFFDPVNKRLRILWLDKNSLILKDLPDECALEHLWSEQTQTGIIEQWTRGLDKLKAEYRRGGNLASQAQAWEKIMDSPPVQIFANTLNTWATDFHQITVIFPAPLGQLPWEILPQLEEKLVREISVAHWLKSGVVGCNEARAVGFHSVSTHPTSWVVCDPSGEAQCMRKEGHWVAHHLETELDAPCPSIFDALYQLEHSNHAHLSTHGIYYRDNPTRSYLSLEDDKKIQLPLWLNSAVRTRAELVMLSACESNLSGQDTEGLLTPLGIGPSLAAAGAKTVVGTLWPCDGVAATCFTYHFYTIATENESLPWHQVVSQARQKLREMKKSDLKTLATELNLNDEEDECCFSVEYYKSPAVVGDYPFKSHVFWAGFTVLGRVARKK